jgi:hypothetical protein
VSEEELRERLEYWQRVLRLQDWRIDVQRVGSDKLGVDLGDVTTDSSARHAMVQILSEEAKDPTNPWQKTFPIYYDEEYTLVHELLHIVFDELIEHSAEDSDKNHREEQAINAVAEALITLGRKAGSPARPV